MEQPINLCDACYTLIFKNQTVLTQTSNELNDLFRLTFCDHTCKNKACLDCPIINTFTFESKQLPTPININYTLFNLLNNNYAQYMFEDPEQTKPKNVPTIINEYLQILNKPSPTTSDTQYIDFLNKNNIFIFKAYLP